MAAVTGDAGGTRSLPVLRPYVASIAAIFCSALLAETGLFSVQDLLWPRAALYAVFMALALVPVRGYVLVVSLACSVGALALSLLFGVSAANTATAFNGSAGIIAFIAAVPAVAIPIRLGGYMNAMEAFVAGTAHDAAGTGRAGRARMAGTFVILSAMHLLMSIVLNIGSIPTMQRLLERSRLPKPYLSAVYAAGYSSYMVLSPFDGLVNALILAAGTTYAAYFSRGLMMAAAIMGVSCVLFMLDAKRHPAPSAVSPATGTELDPHDRSKIAGLAGHIVTMIALSALANRALRLTNPAITTAFVILGYSALWLGMLGVRFRDLRGQAREYAAALAAYRGFLPFLVSAGFLGSMCSWTPLGSTLGAYISSLTVLPRYFTLQAIMLAIAALSVVGIHMMITVVAVSAALSPAALGLSAPGFALFLLSSWLIAMNVSPFVPFSAVVGEAIGEKPTVVSLRYNSALSLLMLVVAPLLVW